MPTEAYALCPRRPMPSRTSYESSKGYISAIVKVVVNHKLVKNV
jgi:hypothetical protein